MAAILLSGSSASVLAGASQAADTANGPSTASTSPLVWDWLDDLIALLERLYQLAGGDPNNLPPDLYPRMSAVTSYYNAHGISGTLTSQQKAQGRADVESAWSMTSGPSPNSTTVQFRIMLRSMYAALGGDPNNLH